ncbi:MAG TPA: endolytic transglycosylase MltG [Bryobacterales bacterium]|nr:endolytic transglycosylase MltG [Bryobacterales bacterium]
MKLRRLLALFLFFGLAFCAGYVTLRPYRGFSGEAFVDIRRGASTLEIASDLASAGVVRSEWPFLLLRLIHPRSVLKAGEYRFDRPVSPLAVYHKILAGDVFYFAVTIPEGYNMFDIAETVSRTGVISREAFLAEARRGERIAAFAQGAPTLEGFLFPDTYRLTRHSTAEQLVGQMLRRFRDVFLELQGAAPSATRNVLEVVTLASLVEKETAVPSERPLAASVFRNRLRLGMPLQCDPTVIYALQIAGRYGGQIHKEDLALVSPYNTYARAGLPPGPIANPGRASLAAALSPAQTDYLYFVADGQGGHIFSKTFDSHSKAVASYVRGARRRASENGKPQ